MLNWMFYFRGHSKDFDEWEELGNPGWGWKDVLPHFKNAERFRGDGDDGGIYGTEGKFSIEKSRFKFAVEDIVLGALGSLGFKIGDVNGKEEDGGVWETNTVAMNSGSVLLTD
jgi:choline dehydrogenase